MPDWKTRLVVSYTENNNEQTITPIDSFSPSFALNAEALHSIEQTHIGVVYSPEGITFSMTVKAMGSAAGDLTLLALEGKRFDINLMESGDGTDWSFKKIVLTDCIITSANPTAASPTGAPTATFSGFSLGGSGKVGSTTVKVPEVPDAEAEA